MSRGFFYGHKDTVARWQRRPCKNTLCGIATDNASGYCDTCADQGQGKGRAGDRRATACQRGYGRQWRKARESYLIANPLCVFCLARRLVVPATVVDHIIPHEGDQALFWDESNWQSLCKLCHDSDKQRMDRATREGGRGVKVYGDKTVDRR